MSNAKDLLTPTLIRQRTRALYEYTLNGQGAFSLHPENWDRVVDYVDEVITENYPTGEIPFHSRLNHFRPGEINRLDWLEQELAQCSTPLDKVQLLFDLVIPSVLLDAGAGADWKFFETKTGQEFARSEGLGVASFHLFFEGGLHHQGQIACSAEGLSLINAESLAQAFQVNEENPLVGVQERAQLLNRLGEVLETRPGELASLMVHDNQVSASRVLQVVLEKLGPIWPSRHELDGVRLGDTWPHPLLGPPGHFDSFVPFHKLSQWMSYSLLDCFKLCGFQLSDLDQLTGLPEYRNGGLFLDLELIKVKDSSLTKKGLKVDDPVVIEWRALTVVLLDELATRLQQKRGLSADQFPLACVLEGGSWWAGRKIAKEKRSDASPPLHLHLDGTVF